MGDYACRLVLLCCRPFLSHQSPMPCRKLDPIQWGTRQHGEVCRRDWAPRHASAAMCNLQRPHPPPVLNSAGYAWLRRGPGGHLLDSGGCPAVREAWEGTWGQQGANRGRGDWAGWRFGGVRWGFMWGHAKRAKPWSLAHIPRLVIFFSFANAVSTLSCLFRNKRGFCFPSSLFFVFFFVRFLAAMQSTWDAGPQHLNTTAHAASLDRPRKPDPGSHSRPTSILRVPNPQPQSTTNASLHSFELPDEPPRHRQVGIRASPRISCMSLWCQR